jgi:hypothetical protein
MPDIDYSADLEMEKVYFPQEGARNPVIQKTADNTDKVNLHNLWI